MSSSGDLVSCMLAKQCSGDSLTGEEKFSDERPEIVVFVVKKARGPLQKCRYSASDVQRGQFTKPFAKKI